MFIINFYLLITATATIALGLQLVNYTEGHTQHISWGYGPIFRQGHRTFTYYLYVQESLPPTGLVHDEDYAFTHHIEVISPPDLTRWEVIRFSLVLEANETVSLRFISYNTQGNVVENLTFTLNSESRREWRYEIVSLGTYKFEIKEYAAQAVPINLRESIEKWVFEKKYFNYGVLGITAPFPTLTIVAYILNKLLATKYKYRSFSLNRLRDKVFKVIIVI